MARPLIAVTGYRAKTRGLPRTTLRTGSASSAKSWAVSRPADSRDIPAEERWQAIAVAAYHLAEARGFVGDSVEYWLAAEAQVDAELAARKAPM